MTAMTDRVTEEALSLPADIRLNLVENHNKPQSA